MPRSNWKGMISFGLVSIPIILYPSENKSASGSFHQIDKRDNARIKYQRVNSNTGKIVPWDEITRGYEYDKDVVIPVPDDILKRVAGDNARSIDIETFVDKKDLDLLSIENVYYVVPDKKGEKGYVILRDALQDTNKIAIAKVIISTKEYLAAVMPHNKALVLCLLKYDNEMRKLSEFDFPTKNPEAYKVKKQEIDIAKKLIKSMSSKWDPAKYQDDYQHAIQKWVEETVKKMPHTPMKQRAHAKTNMINFTELLKESLKSRSKATKKIHKTRRIAKPKLKSARHATRH